MKATIILIITAAVLTLIVSCSTVQPTTEIIVLRDITEKGLARLNAEDVLKIFDVSDNVWNGANFYFGNITDVSYNLINEAKIPARNQWLSNELERGKEVKNFKNKVFEIIADGEKDTIGKRNSSVYLPIARILNQLSQSKAQKRILIVYSDLTENTNEISFYNKKTMKLLRTNPDLIAKQFEGMQTINNLEGIEIYIVFQPVNVESDSDFKTVSELYKNLLEAKGARVTISASLNF